MKRDVTTVVVGILFLAAGVLIGGNMLGYFYFNINLAGWWTLFLIIPALLSITQVGPNAGNVILFGIGTLLLLDQQRILPHNYGWKLIFPVVLLAVGFQILFGNGWRGNGTYYRKNGPKEESADGSFNGKSDGSTDTNRRDGYATRSGGGIFSSMSKPGDGYKKASVTFGGEDIHYGNEDFLGGVYTATFGGLTVNLVNTRITGDVSIDVSAIFGGVEIILPQGVRVISRITPVLGGSECKYPSSNDPAAPTVTVNGTVTFGGVEIK